MKAATVLLDVDRAESAFRLLFRFALDQADEAPRESFNSIISEVLRGLKLPPGAREKLERIYLSVVEEPGELSAIVSQVVRDFEANRPVLLALLSLLLRLTAVEGMISRRHCAELAEVLVAIDLSPLEVELFGSEEQTLLSFIRFGKAASGTWTGGWEAKELAKHYQTLGCPPEISDAELRQAYRGLAKKYHPDRHQKSSREQSRKPSERFIAIHAAYEAVWKARGQ